MSLTPYPSSFPTPTIAGYAIGVDMGVLRTTMSKGGSRQRRRYRSMPHIINAQFTMNLDSLGSWQTWVNAFAYDWFTMDLTSYTSAGGDTRCSPHECRFTSDLNIEAVAENVFSVSVEIEVAPITRFFNPPAVLTNNWVIADDSDVLSQVGISTDWVIADKSDVLSQAAISTDLVKIGRAHV